MTPRCGRMTTNPWPKAPKLFKRQILRRITFAGGFPSPGLSPIVDAGLLLFSLMGESENIKKKYND